MTTQRSPVDSCPACNADCVEFWDDLDSWICGDCGVVLPENELGERTLDELNVDHPDHSTSELEESWRDRISVTDNSEANLVEALHLIDEVAQSVPIQNRVVSRSAEVVTRAWETNFMHGRRKDTTVAAAVYAASREQGCAVPPGVLANSIETEKTSINSLYRKLRAKQDLDIKPPKPTDYVEYICAKQSLSEPVPETATRLLRNTRPVGGNPIGIAAAGVYEAAVTDDRDVTLRDVAETVSLTKETIWRHTKKLTL